MTLKLKNLLKNHTGFPFHDQQKLREADFFDTPGVSDRVYGDYAAGKEDPTSNAAVKKFDTSLKGEPRWNNISKIMLRLSDPKQAEFIEYIMNDMGVSDEAKKRLKLKL